MDYKNFAYTDGYRDFVYLRLKHKQKLSVLCANLCTLCG